MRFWFLVGSLALLLIGALSGSPWALAAGGVGLLTGLAWWGSAPRGPLVLFGLWTAGVLAGLLCGGTASAGTVGRVLGLPWPALWMLLGIWLAPLAIWPLSFWVGFRRWKGR